MVSEGWIKLHRKSLDSWLWSLKPEYLKVALTLLLMVNHEERKIIVGGKEIIIQPGQCWTSLESLKIRCGPGVTINQIRDSLAVLEGASYLTSKSTNQGRLITIINWDSYQTYEQDEAQAKAQANSQAKHKPSTTNKNVRMKEDNYPPEFEEFWKLYPRHIGKKAAFKKWLATLKRDGVKSDDLIRAARNYALKTKGTDEGFIKHPESFLGPNEHWKDYLQETPQPSRLNLDDPEPYG